jgi:hypothetical protein
VGADGSASGIVRWRSLTPGRPTNGRRLRNRDGQSRTGLWDAFTWVCRWREHCPVSERLWDCAVGWHVAEFLCSRRGRLTPLEHGGRPRAMKRQNRKGAWRRGSHHLTLTQVRSFLLLCGAFLGLGDASGSRSRTSRVDFGSPTGRARVGSTTTSVWVSLPAPAPLLTWDNPPHAYASGREVDGPPCPTVATSVHRSTAHLAARRVGFSLRQNCLASSAASVSQPW